MFGFGKKNKEVETSQTPATSPWAKRSSLDDGSGDVSVNVSSSINTAKVKKKKRGEGLSAFFQESVAEVVIEEFKSNTKFKVTKDNTPLYVGLLLDSDDIGGFGRKSKRDEAKGQFIEQVVSGLIHTYMPFELIANDEMVFIPDAQTLAAMDEFMMLSEAPYHVAYIDDRGLVHKTEYPITYEQAVSVANDVMPIEDMLFECGDIDFDDEPALEDEITTTSTSYSTPPLNESSDYDELNLESDASDLEDSYEMDITDNVSSDTTHDTPEPKDSEFLGDLFGENYDDTDVGMTEDTDSDDIETDNIAETVVSDDEMMDAIVRKFYSDDLGLEISTEPFDAQFLHANPYIPFDEQRGEGWLNNYMNEMAKDANNEMRRMRQSNLFSAREKFYQFVSKVTEEIQEKLDTSDLKTNYGKIFDAIKQQRYESRQMIDKRVAERRKDLDKSWNEKLEQVGENAKMHAMQQYRDRYGKEHEATIYRIEPDLRNLIDSEYNTAYQDMQKRRREEASKMLDLGITESLAEVSKIYMSSLEEETKCYKEWRERMNNFLDNHRKDEIAHDKVLAEEQAQINKADKVLAEYTEKLKYQTKEFEAKKLTLTSEIETMERETQEMLRDKQIECDNRIKDMRKELDDQKEEMRRLLDRYSELDEAKERQYKARLAEANDAKLAWSERCENIMALHKKTNTATFALMFAFCVACLAIGTLVGSNLNLNYGSKNVSDAVIQEYKDRLDALEEEKSDLKKQLNATPTVSQTSIITVTPIPTPQVETTSTSTDG